MKTSVVGLIGSVSPRRFQLAPQQMFPRRNTKISDLEYQSYLQLCNTPAIITLVEDNTTCFIDVLGLLRFEIFDLEMVVVHT